MPRRKSDLPLRVLVVQFRPGSSSAVAERYPEKPVRIVVPFAAGGVVDTVTRVIGQKLATAWKQRIVVEYRPGAGGNVGAGVVAKAAPDGYRILMTTHGHAISPSLHRTLEYDPVNDFAPITQLTSGTFLVLAVNSSLAPTPSLEWLIALAKSEPGRVNCGSAGPGTPSHLATELVKMTAGIDMVHVPYPGDAPLTAALLGGKVQAAFLPLVGVLPHLKSGRFRALGITSGKRSPAIPEVPSLAEAGIPGFEFTGWLAALAPAGTPRAIVDKIQGALRKILAMPSIRGRLASWGHEPVGSTPDQFAAELRADITKYAHVIKEVGIPQVA